MALILFPVGRFIGGSLKDLHGRTETDGKTPKLGADGKQMMACNFGVAIPKTPGHTHWSQTPWGTEMLNIAKAAEPVLHQSAAYAWKVIDGDDTRPNKNGKVPATQEGYAGNWILWFSQGWLPKQCNADGSVELQPGTILPGQYVQVQADVAPNGAKPPNTPGLYLNPKAVALVADGPRITTESVDTTKCGFGQAPLPPGALPLQPAVAGFPGAAVVPDAPFQQMGAGAPVAPVPVVPNAGFMMPPPPAPPAPPAPVGPVMTAAANGASYAQYKAAGWSDEQMRAGGLLV
jgi:hypothetical protein